MTRTNGALTLPLQDPPRPLDGTLPDVLVTFDAEYFVEWQVADIAPLTTAGHPER